MTRHDDWTPHIDIKTMAVQQQQQARKWNWARSPLAWAPRWQRDVGSGSSSFYIVFFSSMRSDETTLQEKWAWHLKQRCWRRAMSLQAMFDLSVLLLDTSITLSVLFHSFLFLFFLSVSPSIVFTTEKNSWA